MGTFRVKTLVHAATAIWLGVILWPLSAAALEPLAVYEDWSQALIRPDRWQGTQRFGGQEAKRVVTPGHTLSLRYRHEGSTASDTGDFFADQGLATVKPTAINGIEATFTVSSLSMTTCPANNSGMATLARPARLLIAKFNDGTQSAPANRIGDHFAGVQAQRAGSSTDPASVLRVVGFINRCTNESCTASTTIIANALATTVAVGQSFTLRLQWDQPNHQFLFGLDGSADVALPYAVSDTAAAIVPFVETDVGHTVANCTAGPVVIDSTTQVGTVRTNSSAVIP